MRTTDLDPRETRIVLERPRPDDQEFLDALSRDHGVKKFLGPLGIGKAADLQEVWSRDGYGIFIVWLIATPPDPVGVCGIVASDMADRREIVCAIVPAARERGLALEACRGLLQWAKTQDLTPIHGRVAEGNASSLALVRRLGMREIGSRPDIFDARQLVFEWP